MKLPELFQDKRLKLAAIALTGLGVLLSVILLLLPEGDNPAIRIAGVSESSRARRTAAGKFAVDRKNSTAWITSGKKQGKYEWIRIRFTREILLSKILLINGYAHKHPNRWIGDLYERYGRIRSVRISLSDMASYFWILKDRDREYQSFTLPEPRKTRSVTLYIHNIYKGTVNRELAVSEIAFR